jgi:hypothetical protein
VAFSAPSISGRVRPGQTLTVSPGDWANGPTGYGYQWDGCDRSGRACAPISGATGPTYTVTAADVGRRIRVHESASNSAGRGTQSTSTETAPVPKPPPARRTGASPPRRGQGGPGAAAARRPARPTPPARPKHPSRACRRAAPHPRACHSGRGASARCPSTPATGCRSPTPKRR